MTDRVESATNLQGAGGRLFWSVLVVALLVLLVSTVYFVGESFEPGDSLFVTIMAVAVGAATLSLAWVMAASRRARRLPAE